MPHDTDCYNHHDPPRQLSPGRVLGVFWVIGFSATFFAAFGALITGQWELAARFGLAWIALVAMTMIVAAFIIAVTRQEIEPPAEPPQFTDEQLRRFLNG